MSCRQRCVPAPVTSYILSRDRLGVELVAVEKLVHHRELVVHSLKLCLHSLLSCKSERLLV